MPQNFTTEQYTQEDCLIVHVDLSVIRRTSNLRTKQHEANEAIGLAEAINLNVLHTHIVKLKKIYAGAFLGSGQRDDIAELVEEHKPDVIIFNDTLSPVQQRNLERQWKAKVIDRTGLILEIFGERAQTKEGRLQVDLAMLEYQKSRLVRSWTHLERQRGGAGFMGGPGERQIEIDRRLISEKITRLKSDIEDVKRTRDLGRQSRERVPFPIVALVGYTNAGKSTLFNSLTDAEVMAEDLLFATLDPTMRKLKLPGGQQVILVDTVGFISDLPTDLIAAFRSTLEQLDYADVILHVMDVSSLEYAQQKLDVIQIMADLGIEYETDERILEVWNKIDVLESEDAQDIIVEAIRSVVPAVPISAFQKQGLDELIQKIEGVCERSYNQYHVDIPVTDGKAIAWLYEHAHVLDRSDNEAQIRLTLKIDENFHGKFSQAFAYPLKPL